MSENGQQVNDSPVELIPRHIICHFESQAVLTSPNYLTLQRGDAQHIILKPEFLQSLNHSCDPNIFFDLEKMAIIALKDIKIGEELTFFYPSTQ
ncbi:MAG: SET domain-containing protein [Microcoleaceae cyanobacterium]